MICINNALRHLPSLGNRGSHELLHPAAGCGLRAAAGDGAFDLELFENKENYRR